MHKCGHIYVHPLPLYSEIASLYPNTYYTVNKKSPLHLDGAIYEKKLGSDARKLRRSLQGFNIRSIVDVGAGEVNRFARLKEAFGGNVEAIAFDIQFEPDVESEAKKCGVKLVHGKSKPNRRPPRQRPRPGHHAPAAGAPARSATRRPESRAQTRSERPHDHRHTQSRRPGLHSVPQKILGRLSRPPPFPPFLPGTPGLKSSNVPGSPFTRRATFLPWVFGSSACAT